MFSVQDIAYFCYVILCDMQSDIHAYKLLFFF
jgi:hypothetical protein